MYSITLKAPNGKKCLDINSGNCMDNIDEWLQKHIMINKTWKGELFYNDEIPYSKKHIFSGGGHNKGILVWNDKEVGWLIHSVPLWPETLLNSIPHAETENGQSFVWILLSIDKLPLILNQIQLMHSHIYHDTQNIFVPLKHHPKQSELLSFVNLDNNIYHIAKHDVWNDDLFENGLAKVFVDSKWKSETWGRPLQLPTSNVERIHEICWKYYDIKCSYTNGQDHSKWAISDKETCCVFIGDINAMTSQFHRGGGGIIIKKDNELWNKLNYIIIQ